MSPLVRVACGDEGSSCWTVLEPKALQFFEEGGLLTTSEQGVEVPETHVHALGSWPGVYTSGVFRGQVRCSSAASTHLAAAWDTRQPLSR